MERRFSGGAAERVATRKASNKMPSVNLSGALGSGGQDAPSTSSGQAPTTAAGTAAPLFRCATLFRLLVEGIDGESAEEFGIEVGGFLGHDLAREGDVTDLRHPTGIHQESDISLPAVCAPYLRQGLGGVADVGDVLLVADGFFRKVQDFFQ